MSQTEFQKFLEILHSGDAKAVDNLLAEFDPFLKRAVKLRLFDHRARRVVDTADILQSLFKDFLNRKEIDESSPSAQTLRNYLAAAAHYKIAAKVRKERRRTANLGDVEEPVSPGPSPTNQVENRDLIETIRSRLDDESRRLLELSQQGRTWREIAKEVGGHPDTLRIQLRRSIAAVLADLRDGESSHAG